MTLSEKKGNRTVLKKAALPGCPGYMILEFYNIASQSSKRKLLETEYRSSSFKFTFNGAAIDLKKGKIDVQEKGDIAENLALAFSVSLLHVLCQPRPSDWEPGKSLAPKEQSRGSKSVKYIQSEDLVLIMAAGTMIGTPSNFYIRQHFGLHYYAACGGGGANELDGDTGLERDGGDGGGDGGGHGDDGGGELIDGDADVGDIDVGGAVVLAGCCTHEFNCAAGGSKDEWPQ